MIGHLRGTLLTKKPYHIVLEVGGVGYELRVPYSVSQLPKEGQALSLVVHTHVREDALTLYGFKSAGEREAFQELLTVKGVGPKVALTALSGLSPQDIRSAVRRNNPLALVIPGIGPKTAERIVHELRGRLEIEEEPAAEGAAPSLGEAAEEAISALENMGCEPKLAQRAVREVLQSQKVEATFETLMKAALQWLREKKR
jgi:Holliday junction DNA helicase RuvA